MSEAAIPLHLAPKPRLRGWSHAVAAIAAVALCPIVIVLSPGARAAAAIYAVATIGLFGTSAVYHRFRWGPRMHTVLRRLDHSMIFVAIAATYTPIAVVVLPPGPGTLMLVVAWTGAAVGVGVQLFWPSAPRGIVVGLYLTVGWAALLVIDEIWHAFGTGGFTLMVIGGLLHTIGAVVYAFQRPDPWPRWFGFHEIFHLFVVAAIATHYVMVTMFALPQVA
jgi:hemolysin III